MNQIDKEEILNDVSAIMRTLFADENLCISANTTPADISAWDSFENINLLVLVEAKFHVRFDMQKIADLTNVGDIVNAVAEKLKL